MLKSSIKFALGLVCCSIGLSACGGVAVNSPARGSYQGTFTSSNGDNGTANLTISDGGSVTGGLNDKTSGQNAALSGSISDSEFVTATLAYSKGSPESVSGAFTKNAKDQFAGTLKGGAGSFTFLLTKE